ncbi:MAG: hypothetical protein DI536_01635 [Archangium gephyra]|uniref:Linalool dehydratase/isomerase domain-containing protein n=1 Tax=Archangium gephyra TaxID=48 RepID=A0A2W5TS93_9BACT|nr:MAG: hypothetical protein DI536_01635 [Archangium gephyra]
MKRLRRAGFFFFVVSALTVLRVEACASRDDAESRYAYVAERIQRHQLPGLAPGHPFDGEWTLIAISEAVASSVQLAVRHPERRETYARNASDWARLLASPEVRAYDTKQWGSDPLTTLGTLDAHVGYLGHVALAMDAGCLLGGERDEPLHDEIVNALARRFSESERGLLETYPAETYLPHNLVAMAGIAQYDACVGSSRHRQLIDAWLAKVKKHWLDDGVLVFAPGQPARGSGAAWNSFYLPLIDEAFAADQSERMWTKFGDTAVGGWLGELREWPVGVDREGDVDSGPLVFGISPSATGYALGDAVLRGRPIAGSIIRNAELTGVTLGDRYVLSPFVGDAITLASRTATRWPTKPMHVDKVSNTLLVPSGLHARPRTAVARTSSR